MFCKSDLWLVTKAECKYYNDTFSIDKEYAQNLKNKKQKLMEHELTNKKFDLKVVLLTTYGTKVNRYYNEIPVAKDVRVGDLLGWGFLNESTKDFGKGYSVDNLENMRCFLGNLP